MKLNKSQVFRVTLLVVFFISLIICCGLLSACNNENLIRVYFYDEYGNLIKYGSGDYAPKDKNKLLKTEIENWSNYINAKIEKLILEGNGDSETNSVSASESIGADEQDIFAKYLEKYKNEGYINALGYKFEFYGEETIDKELDKKRPVYKVKLNKELIEYTINFKRSDNESINKSITFNVNNELPSIQDENFKIGDCEIKGYRYENSSGSNIDINLDEISNTEDKISNTEDKISNTEDKISKTQKFLIALIKGKIISHNFESESKIDLYPVYYSTITIDGTPIGYEYNKQTVLPQENPTKLGYSFTGWTFTKTGSGEVINNFTFGNTMPAYNITATPNFSPIEYTIEYVIDSDLLKNPAEIDDLPKDYTIENGNVSLTETELSVKEGYIFDGWYSDRAHNKGVSYIDRELINELINKDSKTITLYAKVSPKEYTITYENLKGADNSINNPTKYTVESETIIFNEISQSGYEFNGWDITSIEKGSTGDKTVTAIWTAKVYKITYNLNIGAKSNQTMLKPKCSVIEDNIIYGANYELTTPTCDYYSFIGWYNSDGYLMENGIWNTTSDIELFAHWKLNEGVQLINSKEDFIKLTSAVTTEEVCGTYVFAKNISLGAIKPIAKFSGILDGYGFTISYEIINSGVTKEGSIYSGLVAEMLGGTITNLNVAHTIVEYMYLGHANIYVGGIVALISNGTISNCTISYSTITGITEELEDKNNLRRFAIVGGIAGKIYNKSTISSCSTIASNVYAKSHRFAGGGTKEGFTSAAFAGGVCGESRNSSIHATVKDNTEVKSYASFELSHLFSQAPIVRSYSGGVVGNITNSSEVRCNQSKCVVNAEYLINNKMGSESDKYVDCCPGAIYANSEIKG